MENQTSTHQGPVTRVLRGSSGKKESNEDIEARRKRWRDAYYASKAAKQRKQRGGADDDRVEKKRAAARAYYHRNKGKKARVKVKKVRGGKDGSGPVPKTGNKTDALIYLNKALGALANRDYEGTELFARLCRRVLQGRE